MPSQQGEQHAVLTQYAMSPRPSSPYDRPVRTKNDQRSMTLLSLSNITPGVRLAFCLSVRRAQEVRILEPSFTELCRWRDHMVKQKLRSKHPDPSAASLKTRAAVTYTTSNDPDALHIGSYELSVSLSEGATGTTHFYSSSTTLLSSFSVTLFLEQPSIVDRSTFGVSTFTSASAMRVRSVK